MDDSDGWMWSRFEKSHHTRGLGLKSLITRVEMDGFDDGIDGTERRARPADDTARRREEEANKQTRKSSS